MKRVIDYLKNLISWDKDISLKKYDVYIALLVAFLISYTTFYALKTHNRISASKPAVIKIELSKVITNDVVYTVGPTNHSLTLDTKVKTEYAVGEIVGVKHLGILGIIVEKTLAIGGYKYEIIYRDTSGAIQRTAIDTWLLYHPQKEQISPFFLLN